MPRIYPLDLSVWKILTYDVVMEELYLIEKVFELCSKKWVSQFLGINSQCTSFYFLFYNYLPEFKANVLGTLF